jgi:hypothetical protein
MSVKFILNNPQNDGTGGSPSVLDRMIIADMYCILKQNTFCRQLLNQTGSPYPQYMTKAREFL